MQRSPPPLTNGRKLDRSSDTTDERKNVMSKAFTKEDDGAEVVRLQDLPQSPNPNYVTPTGLAALRSRLNNRKADLSELLEKDESLSSQHAIALAQRDVRFLQGRIDRAILIRPEEQPPTVVAFGAEVEVTLEDGTCQTYRIVGEDEADPSQGLIAPYSPLAIALIGSEVGDNVVWRKPAGAVELVVKVIRYA